MRRTPALTTCIIVTIVIAGALLSGCSPRPAAPMKAYTLVYLKSGAGAKDKTPEQRNEIQAAHLENIGRLAKEGSLVVAGPFGKINHDPTQRGIFIFDVPSIEEAQALTNTDPAVKAGVLVLEPHTFRSDANLRAVVQTDLDIAEQAKREGRTLTMQERLRSYVMLRADDADAADRALAKALPAEEILIAARVDGNRGFYVLDATDVEAMRSTLESSGLSAFRVDEWFATKQVTEARSRPAEKARWRPAAGSR